MTGLGTVINVVAIVVGAGLGAVLGDRLPKRWRELLVSSLALFLLAMGVYQAMQAFTGEFAAAAGGAATIIVLGALVVGSGLGSLLDIEAGLDRLGANLQRRFAKDATAAGGSAFATGFVTATLLFVVGPMAVLGSFADGVQGDPGILAVKSILDGVMSLAFAASLGWGVGLSAVPVLLYQGGLTALASVLSAVMVPAVVGSLTAVGGVLILAISVRLLELREIAVANLLPALPLAPVATAVYLALA
ncbi:putative membrane protein YqgA involved in biofilm formation [Crossiella equi]|uniref:Membrane protein YqgA involved in biofilm formation n=1 Tax=Crossiella equi TaxID=130796 RepID=A0ABS5A3W5_9PSEU|nr:DUF554 domain-containing protein [Crossiella equi]MBP2471274.1 putative membrane protein YqgA involved in biofilm formation [Crossiella equi]